MMTMKLDIFPHAPMKMPFFLCLLLSMNPWFSFSQDYLSPEQAIRIALANNFDILIADQERNIALNNEKLGWKNMMPTLDAEVGLQGSNRNLRQVFVSGNEVNQNNVLNREANYALRMDWVIFDGLAMFARKESLHNDVDFFSINKKIQIQELMEKVLLQYYGIVAEQYLFQSLLTLQSQIEKKREIAQQKKDVGVADQTEWLMAEMEWMQLQNQLLLIRNNTRNQKSSLLLLIGEEDINRQFETDTQLQINEQWIGTIDAHSLSENPEWQALNNRLTAAGLFAREQKAMFLPKVQLFSSYTGINAEADAGFLLNNRNYGLNYGVTARIPILSNGQIKNQYLNAKHAEDIALLKLKQKSNELQWLQKMERNNFQQFMSLMENEKKRGVWANQLLQITMNKYEQGLATILEVKEAQTMFADVQYNYTSFLLQTKMAEVKLMKLHGHLLH
jgi:outer membrane protein